MAVSTKLLELQKKYSGSTASAKDVNTGRVTVPQGGEQPVLSAPQKTHQIRNEYQPSSQLLALKEKYSNENSGLSAKDLMRDASRIEHKQVTARTVGYKGRTALEDMMQQARDAKTSNATGRISSGGRRGGGESGGYGGGFGQAEAAHTTEYENIKDEIETLMLTRAEIGGDYRTPDISGGREIDAKIAALQGQKRTMEQETPELRERGTVERFLDKVDGVTQNVINFDKYLENKGAAADARVRNGEKNADGNNASGAEIFGGAIVRGMSDFNRQVASGLDFIMPTDFLGEYDPFSALNDKYSDINETLHERQAYALADRPAAVRVGSEVLSGTTAALPQAITAMLTLGGSGAAQLAPQATSFTGTMSNAIKEIAKNPGYWQSFITTVGGEYEAALESGGDSSNAAVAAIISSMLNSVVEIGGGIQTLPESLQKTGNHALVELIKSGLDEGKEEVIQSLISGVMQKGMVNSEKTTFSMRDENAVVNPVSLAKDFGMGAAVGLLLGGGESALIGTRNAVVNNQNADAILSNAQAVAELQRETGLVLHDDMTRGEQREAVQDALETYQRNVQAEQETPAEETAQESPSEETVQRAEETERVAPPEEQGRAPLGEEAVRLAEEMARERFAAQEPALAAELTAPGEERANSGTRTVNSGTRTMNSGTERVQPNVRAIQDAASAFGAQSGKALVDFYDGEQNTAEYLGAFAAHYHAAQMGKDAGSVKAEYQNVLSAPAREAAILMGQIDAAQSLKTEQENVKFATAYGKDSGFIQNEHSKKLAPKTMQYLNALAKATGTKVQMVAAQDGVNGYYQNGVIHISANAENPAAVVMRHEITHRMQELAPEAYRAYRDYAVAVASKGDISATVEEHRMFYASRGVNLSAEQAMDEIAADFTEHLAIDISKFEKLARENRPAAIKLRDAVRDIVRKVKKLLGKSGRGTQGEGLFDVEKLEEAERLWTKALEETSKQAKRAQKNTDFETGETPRVSEVSKYRYSIKRTRGMTLNAQLKMFYDGRMATSDAFYFGETPAVLSAVGLDENALVFTISDFKKSTKIKHNIPRRVLKNLTNNLNKPILAFVKGKNVGILLNDIDGGGKPLLVGIEADVTMDRKKVNVIQTIFGLDNPSEWLRNQEEGGKRYVVFDKERANAFLQTHDHTVSVGESIRSSENSIPQNGEDGNTKFSLAGSPYLGKSLSEDSEVYSYDFLTALPDMQVITLPATDKIRDSNNRVDARKVVDAGIENARSVGTEKEGKLFVRNRYTEREIRVDAKAIRHGLSGDIYRLLTNARMGAVIGNLVENAVPVNALHNKANHVQGTYAMSSYVTDGEGREFIAVITVEQRSDSVSEMEVYDVTHAINGRQKNRSKRADTKSQGVYPTTNASTISIQELLEVVKSTHQSILSEDVLARMGEERNPEGHYFGQAKFSLAGSGELIKANAALQNQVEKLQKLLEYHKGQMRRTESVTTEVKEVNKAARRLVKEFSADVPVSEIAAKMQGLYDYIASGKDGKNELTWEGARERAEEIARELVENALVQDDSYAQYLDLRDYLRTTKLTISESDKQDIADFNDFRKHNFGRLKIANGETNIDSVFQELSMMWPEFFDENVTSHPADQLQRIADVASQLFTVTEYNPYRGYVDQAVKGAANEILEMFFALPQTKKTFADKAAMNVELARINEKERSQAALAKERTRSRERMEQFRTDTMAQTKEMLAKEKERRYKVIEELREENRVRERASRENWNAKELRGKILRHTSKLSQKLIRPNDKQHIPENLRQAVASMLDAINLESLYSYDKDTGALQRSPDGDPTRRTESFRALREIYGAIAKSDVDYTLVIDPDLLENLSEVEKMRDKPIAAMSAGELSVVWQAIKGIEASIRTANEMLGESRFETISEAAEGIYYETAGRADRGNFRGALGKVDKLVNLDMLTPEAYFHRLGATGDSLFQMLRRSQDRHVRLMEQARVATDEIIGKTDIRKLESEMHKFEIGGTEIAVSTAQIMTLYELMQRRQAEEHILKGGIRPESVAKGKGLRENRRAEPVHLTVEDVGNMIAALSPEQKKIADGLQRYMGGQMARLGNEASMEVYGYEKFKDPRYFPITTDKNQVKKDAAKEAQAGTIAGRGFTKGTTPHASNAVMIGSIFDVYASHVNDMGTYAAWLATMENMRRVRDFVVRDSDGERIGDVKSSIERVLGKNGNAYLNQLMDDINQGVRTQGTGNLTDGLVGNYKAAAIAANIRVIVQQPTAVLRALNMIDAKYLAAGSVKRGDWEKVKKYAPIAIWKDWGYFDINTGRQMKDVLFDSDSRLDKVKQIAMEGAGKADSFAWSRLWNAVEAETKHERKELAPGTDTFYRAVAERFNEIVDKTQVVDGLLQRSQIMRSPDALTKMSTSFMAEPTKTYNMFLSAAYDVRNAKGRDAKRAAKRKAARTTAALVTSFAANAVMQSLVDALRNSDKEKKYWEKLLSAYIGFTGDEEELLDYWNSFWDGNLQSNFNPLSYLPYFKDIVSIMQGYDVTRMDMEALEKVFTAATNMKKTLSGEGKHSLAGASANLMAEAARLLGLPVANLKRDVQGVITTAAIQTDNYLLQYRIDAALLSLGYAGNKKNFMDILYNASLNDREAYEIIYADMVSRGFGEEQVRSSMESRIRKAQGVESVAELEERYLTPTQEKAAAERYEKLEKSKIWSTATDEEREKAEEAIYNLAVENAQGIELQEKLSESAKYGISETDYLLYMAAKEMADNQNADLEKRNGSIDQLEAEAAIEMLEGLSNEARAYLWQSTNKGWKEEKNPWR